MNNLDLLALALKYTYICANYFRFTVHTWTVSTSVGTVFSGPVLVEPQTLGVHVSPAVQSVLVAAPVYNCNVNIAVSCLPTLGLLRSATENSKLIFDLLRDATQNSKNDIRPFPGCYGKQQIDTSAVDFEFVI